MRVVSHKAKYSLVNCTNKSQNTRVASISN